MAKQSFKNGKKWAIRGLLILILILVLNMAKLRAEELSIINAVAPVLGTPLSESQQEGVRQIVRAWRKYGDGDKRKLAYILATSRHETQFKSIAEYRCKEGSSCRQLQDKYWYSNYYGRGLPQLTWKGNYQKMSAVFDIDFTNNPDLLLNPVYGARVLVYGMMNGTFSGKKLGDYINSNQANFVGARRVVNGNDRADLLATYAIQIYNNL